MTRIGLFGGTFNPVHLGHLRIAEEIKEHFSLENIIFIPTGIPPHKKRSEVIDTLHRLRMIELAILPYKYFSVSPIEAYRQGFSYSIDTVKALQEEFGENADLYFIAGIDAFLDIKTWKDADVLLTLCNFVVIPRPSHRFIDLKDVDIPVLKEVSADDLGRLDRREISRLAVPLAGHFHLFLEQITPCDISSTVLRRLVKEGKGVENLLPDSVASYIMEKRLYQ